MAIWENEDLRLHPRHGWRARPGCKIFVADRGAVRFDYPQDWVVVPGEGSVQLHDQEPPDDDCRLTVSYLRFPAIDWRGLPVAKLLEAALREDEPSNNSWGPIAEVQRGDLELAWREVRYIDAAAQRDARSRTCIARQSGIHCVITFDFWAADLERCAAAWTTVLETLELGAFVADPTRGPRIS